MAPVDEAPAMAGWPEHTHELMSMLDARVPIIQAGMDGAATPPLVSAVVNAGGVGTLPLTWRTPDAAAAQIAEVKRQTSGTFMANYVLNFSMSSLDTALEAGVRVVQFSWGLPDRYILDKLARHSVTMGIQVIGEENARRALDLGADFLICQGLEAGGHVQANAPLMRALDEVLAVAGDTPVAAAGGISDGATARKLLFSGAAAVVMGTRFVATTESAAHDQYKARLVAAQGAADTVLTVCLNKVWPNATHRILRSNHTLQMWEAQGRPPGPLVVADGPLVGNRPGEHDVVAVLADGSTLERYMDNVPVASMRHVDVDALGTFAGEGVGEIRGIVSAAEVIQRIVEEYEGAK